MKAKDWLELAEIAAGFTGIPLLGAAIDVAQKLLDFLARQREIAGRTRKWSKEDRAKVDARWEELIASKAWKTDAEGG